MRRGKYLPEFVYGATDGVVTTFAVVTGVIGAQLSPLIVLILGFANLFADGFSMALSDYLSVRSENEVDKKTKKFEKNPKKTALVTFLSFSSIGFTPILPFALGIFFTPIKQYQILLSIILTAIAFIIIGAVKGEVVGKHKVRSALETLVVGGIAATISFLVGYLLRSFIG